MPARERSRSLAGCSISGPRALLEGEPTTEPIVDGHRAAGSSPVTLMETTFQDRREDRRYQLSPVSGGTSSSGLRCRAAFTAAIRSRGINMASSSRSRATSMTVFQPLRSALRRREHRHRRRRVVVPPGTPSAPAAAPGGTSVVLALWAFTMSTELADVRVHDPSIYHRSDYPPRNLWRKSFALPVPSACSIRVCDGPPGNASASLSRASSMRWKSATTGG